MTEWEYCGERLRGGCYLSCDLPSADTPRYLGDLVAWLRVTIYGTLTAYPVESITPRTLLLIKCVSLPAASAAGTVG